MSDGAAARPAGRPWLLWTLSSVLVALPFLVVRFPPATDLPQHVSQIHLLQDVLAGRAPDLTISWWTPNTLVYVLLGATWLLAVPPLSGKLALLVIALAWVVAAFYLARRLGRPPEHAALASVFVFNTSLYWGFLPFLLGWPVFALWLVASLRPLTRATWSRLVGLSVLLYAAHALWFLMGAVWLAVAGLLIGPRRPRHLAARLSALAPIGLAAAAWYPWLVATRQAAGFEISPEWLTTPLARLDPHYMMVAGLVGIDGPLEIIVGLGVLAWIIASVAGSWREPGWLVDRPLLACAGLLWAASLLAPDRYVNTILLGSRWLPPAVICLVLALPAPRLAGPRLRAAAAVAMVALVAVVTAAVWRAFERTELSGLEGALDALPPGQRVLGLDFVKTSQFVRGRPFLQTAAYAQALRGATLNFSFAEHASGLVRSGAPARPPWTGGLEWRAERVRAQDLAWFDYVLVNGLPAMHEIFASNPQVRPVTGDGRWRLYRVVRQAQE